MAAILTSITGQDILNNVGSQISTVGRFYADDIDQDVTDNGTYAEPNVAVAWMQQLFTDNGLDSANCTSLQAAYGNRAMLWRCWCYYFELSRTGENCPAECKDPERFWELYNRGKKKVCDNLQLLGFSDTSGVWCRAENKTGLSKSLDAFGANTRYGNEHF